MRGSCPTSSSAASACGCSNPYSFLPLMPALAPSDSAMRRSVPSVPYLSGASDGHAVDTQRRRVDAGLELEVVGGRHVAEHLLEIAGDGDLAHGIGELAADDP